MLEKNKKGTGILLLNTKNYPSAWVPMSDKDMLALKSGNPADTSAAKIFKTAADTNSTAFIVKSDTREAFGNLQAFAKKTSLYLNVEFASS